MATKTESGGWHRSFASGTRVWLDVHDQTDDTWGSSCIEWADGHITKAGAFRGSTTACTRAATNTLANRHDSTDTAAAAPAPATMGGAPRSTSSGRRLGDMPAPRYTVDLDTPARDRWVPVAKGILKAHGFSNSWGKIFDYLIGIIPLKDWKKLDTEIKKILYTHYAPDYTEEIKGLWGLLVSEGCAKQSETKRQKPRAGDDL